MSGPTQESMGFPRQTPAPIALQGDGAFVNIVYPPRNTAWTTAGSVFGSGGAFSIAQSRPYSTLSMTAGSQGQNPPVYTAATGLLAVSLPAVTGFPAIYIEQFFNWRGRTDKTKTGAPQLYNTGRILRVLFTASFVGGVGTSTQDCGFELLGSVPNHGILANTLPGVGIILDTDGNMKFIIQGAGLTKIPLGIAGFDRTQFHCYEFRLTASSAAQDGSVEFWVDGVPIQRLLWGTDTILPTLTDNGGLYGTILNYLNSGQCTINVYQLHWMTGNQLADVL